MIFFLYRLKANYRRRYATVSTTYKGELLGARYIIILLVAGERGVSDLMT